MSDPATEPGAPTGGAVEVPAASEKSVSREITARTPAKVLDLARIPDRIILRLNKLLSTPGGVAAFLSTFNYTLYLVTYIEAKSVPLLARLYQLINRVSGRPLLQPAVPVGPSRAAALGALLSSTRTTLRLLGLFPLYAWGRQLLQGPKPGQDGVLHATAVAQCALYMAFQALENIGLLTDSGVLPPSYTARWADRNGKSSRILLWSYRAWFAGVLCDVVRLAREAQLLRDRRADRSSTTDVATREEDRKADEKWWADLVVPLSWIPVAAQFSKEGGYPWFNLGIMGACGASAGLGKTIALWEATADV